MAIWRSSPLLRGSLALRKAPIRASFRGLASTAPAELKKTGLYDFHVAHGAKMVPFAGYSMPLAYGDVGQVASHNHVRTSVGLFDVGHMVQSIFRGPTATAFLEWLTPSALSALQPYTSTLSVLLNERGGIIDDTVITKHAETAFYVVTNAGRRARDLEWFAARLAEWNAGAQGAAGPVELEVLEDWGLLALQGPEAASYLQALTSFDLTQLTFGKSAFLPIEGFNLHVARGGYTGEDGFEISIPPSQTVEVAALLSKAPVQLTGLGARDSLRLEAGMCLYGSDLDEDTTPVEGGLTWVIGKERRESGTFIGAEGVRAHLTRAGPPRRRVGLVVEGAPARHGAQIFDPATNELLGSVTSGIPSPTLKQNIAMGYVRRGWHTRGTALGVEVRGKMRKAVVSPMPFVAARYWRGAA
ncbi:aminomethyltransferase [Mycena maculata]|uniref:Aminomethyltransferase n=1 Tax=Mycena maculata TaxID=230809 RepID=A0AAD7I8B4_9AGAR|nr:aminomethyltransferase [Mycena maculata]